MTIVFNIKDVDFVPEETYEIAAYNVSLPGGVQFTELSGAVAIIPWRWIKVVRIVEDAKPN